MIEDMKKLWAKGWLDGAYYIKNSNGEYEVSIFQDKRKDYRFIGSSISEFVCEVPSYEQWKPFTDPYFRGLSTKDIAELAKKSIRLTKQHCEDNEEIEILREQLDLKNDMVDKLIRENERLKKWCEEFNALNVAEENQRLKELLKECKETIETSVWGNCSELTDQIDEVLNVPNE